MWSGAEIDAARVDFEFNAIGRETNIRRYSDAAASALVGQTSRTYNLSNRSTSVSHRDAVDQLVAEYEYEYDFLGVVKQERQTHCDAAFSRTRDFNYDAGGQLIETIENGVQTGSYQYDDAGNRTGADVANGANNQIVNDGVHGYEYDGEGNLIRKTALASGDVTTYTYDHRNRLTSVVVRNADGELVKESYFKYDPMNRRIEVTRDGETIQSVYDRDHVWADYDASGDIVARYLYGNEIDQILARHRPNEGTAWHLSDKLKSVRDLTDATGTHIAHIGYDAFGNILTESDPLASGRYLFTGREWDSEKLALSLSRPQLRARSR